MSKLPHAIFTSAVIVCCLAECAAARPYTPCAASSLCLTRARPALTADERLCQNQADHAESEMDLDRPSESQLDVDRPSEDENDLDRGKESEQDLNRENESEPDLDRPRESENDLDR